jgi:hypothetical protein
MRAIPSAKTKSSSTNNTCIRDPCIIQSPSYFARVADESKNYAYRSQK